MPGGLKPVLWLHADSPDLKLLAIYPKAPAICVLPPGTEAPVLPPRVSLRSGDPLVELPIFLDEQDANQIITPASDSPGFAAIVRELKRGAMVKVVKVE